MLPIIFVAGTHQRERLWGEALCAWLRTQGVEVIYLVPWSTELPVFNHWAWQSGGEALYDVWRAGDQCIPGKALVVSHSHGSQVAAYALASGLKADVWLDICGPVRPDMRHVYEAARTNVRRWRSDAAEPDPIQLAGGGCGPNPLADTHETWKGAPHDLLYHPDWTNRVWPVWVEWLKHA